MSISKENKQKITEAALRGIETLRKRRLNIYLLSPICCLECKNTLEYNKRNNKFCSKSCAAIYNNKRRGKLKICSFCNTEFKTRNINALFCCKKCEACFRKNLLNKKIESGISVTAGALRRYLMEIQKESCSICGWSKRNPISNSVCLDLHHKDGNANNNVLSNVELICPNCHSLTTTYKKVGNTSRKSVRIRK